MNISICYLCKKSLKNISIYFMNDKAYCSIICRQEDNQNILNADNLYVSK